MEYISASKLKSFRSCPYQCKNEKFIANEAVDFGKAVHAGLAAFLTGKDFWTAYCAEATKLALPERREDAQKALEFAESMEIPQEQLITVESEDGEVEFYGNKYFQVPITKEWGIRGAMDAVWVDEQGRLVILDWKTGLTKEEDDVQLALYALAAWKKYGNFAAIKCVYAYTQQGYSQVTYWDAESLVASLDYLKPLIVSYLTALKNNQWERTPHKYCKWCTLKDDCEPFLKQLEAKQDRASYDIEPTLGNLPAILEYHDKVKAIADAAYSIQQMMKGKYEAVFAAHGKQNIGGRIFEITQKTSRYNYNLEAIFNSAAELVGRAPLELCEYSSTGAKELEKSLDKERKKVFKAIIEANREVKSVAKTLKISLAKETEESEN